jgi:hypothetical protein
MDGPRTLAAISSQELLGGADTAVSLGHWRARSAGVAAVATARAAPVIREMPAVWRLETGPDVDPSAMDVRYQLLSAGGGGSCIGHERDAHSALCLTVVPLRPRVISRDEHRTLIEGGVQLEIDLGAATRAGRYSGTLAYSISVY